MIHDPQVAFNYNAGSNLREWTADTPADENVICVVDTAQSALALVASGMGIAFVPDTCVQKRDDIRFVPLRNWHQALYMCITFDKWLEPSVWQFVETLVKEIRAAGAA